MGREWGGVWVEVNSTRDGWVKMTSPLYILNFYRHDVTANYVDRTVDQAQQSES